MSYIASSQLSKTNVLSRNIQSENQNSTHVVNETSSSLGHSTMPLLDLTFDDANTVSHASQVNSASTIFTLANSFNLVPSVPPTIIDHLEPNYKHEEIFDAIVVASPVTVTSDLFLSPNMPSHPTTPTPPTQSVPAVNPPDYLQEFGSQLLSLQNTMNDIKAKMEVASAEKCKCVHNFPAVLVLTLPQSSQKPVRILSLTIQFWEKHMASHLMAT